MGNRSIAVMLGAACAMVASVAFADTQRLCVDADLSGSFKQVKMTENPKGEETAFAHDYSDQYFKFYPATHTYGFVAFSHRLKTVEELDNAIAEAASSGAHIFEKKYTLDSTGLLNVYLEDKLQYSYRCMVVTEASGGNKVGDIILTGYSSRNALLYKFFRHWP